MSLGSLSYRGGANSNRERLIIPTSLKPPVVTASKPQEYETRRYTETASATWNYLKTFTERLRSRENREMAGILGRYAPKHLIALIVLWLIAIQHYERVAPRRAIARCEWSAASSNSARQNQSRIALVADPQILDDNSYPGRPKTLLSITKYIVDIYLRRNWVYINKELDPDAIIFLGDLFDGGREWDDGVWRQEFERFNRIFSKPAYKRTLMNLPGNHDIGYGDTVVPHALTRFQAYFGPSSTTFDIANHTIVLLDTISMMNTKNPDIFGPPNEFADNFRAEVLDAARPRVLLTHVPLFRPKGSDCGQKRESHNGLSYTKGYQYQTQITPEITESILSRIQPTVVFSGDDHDACHVAHDYVIDGQSRVADEFTVKSVSMAMGISQPGIQLLTLKGDPTLPAEASYETHICLMPSPFAPFIAYGILSMISLVIIIAYRVYPLRLHPLLQKLGPSSSSYSSSSLLQEDLPLHRHKKEPSKNLSSTMKLVLYDSAAVFFAFVCYFMYLNSRIFDRAKVV